MNAIVKGDMAVIEFRFWIHEPEGMFRYFPAEEDKFTLIVHDEQCETLLEKEIDTSDPDYLFVDIDTTNIEPGTYLYDVIGKLDGEERDHHIIYNQKLKIVKECM